VPQPQVVDGEAVVLDVFGVEGAGGGELAHIDVVEVVGGAGELDVVRDVLGFPCQRLRLDLETIHHRRVDEEGGDGDEDPSGHGHQCERPAASPDIDYEQARRHEGDGHQEPEGGQAGHDIG